MITPTHLIEHVCGIPFIYEILKELHIIDILNEVYITHRNWTGLPIGETIAIWICYCLTENDHCMCPLEKWVGKNHHLLSKLVKCSFNPKCFTDDHLARVLSILYDSDLWNQFESKLNSSTLRIYGLMDEKVVRVDMTTASSDAIVSEGGLIQFGNSKDDPTRPQIKIVLSVLDKLGLPLTANVVPGNCADDPLYIPTMERVKQTTNQSGLLFVGDCKMGAINTRLHVVINDDFYLSPLSEVSFPNQEILQAVQSHQEKNLPFTQVSRTYFNGADAIIAEGFEQSIIRSGEHEGKMITWEERLIFAKSFSYAKKMVISLNERVNKAQSEIIRMNDRGKGKKVYDNITEAHEKVNSIIASNRVMGIIDVEFTENVNVISKRKYGDKPERLEHSVIVQVKPTVNMGQQSIWKLFKTRNKF
jgi:transposase